MLREAGIHDYSIFLDEETLHLFAVLKLREPNQRASLPQHPAHAPLVGVHAGPDGNAAGRTAASNGRCVPVFHLD